MTEAWASTNENDIDSPATEPPDILSVFAAFAAAVTVAANCRVSQQIAQTASNEVTKAQAVLANWLNSFGKPE